MSGVWTSAWVTSPVIGHSPEDPEINRNMAAVRTLPLEPGETIQRENEDSSFKFTFIQSIFFSMGWFLKAQTQRVLTLAPHIPGHEGEKNYCTL